MGYTKYKEAFSRIVRERRNELGLTQKDVATRMSTTEMSISRYERGECLPRLEQYLSLMKALNFTPEKQEAIFKGIFNQQNPEVKTPSESLDDMF